MQIAYRIEICDHCDGKLISQLPKDDIGSVLTAIGRKIVHVFFEVFGNETFCTMLNENAISFQLVHFFNKANPFNDEANPKIFMIEINAITLLPDQVEREKKKNLLILFLFKFFKTYWRSFWNFVMNFTEGVLDGNYDLLNHPMTQAFLDPGIFNQDMSLPQELEELKMALKPDIILMRRKIYLPKFRVESAEVESEDVELALLEEITEDVVVNDFSEMTSEEIPNPTDMVEDQDENRGKDQDRTKITFTLKTCDGQLYPCNVCAFAPSDSLWSHCPSYINGNDISTWKKAVLDAAERVKQNFLSAYKIFTIWYDKDIVADSQEEKSITFTQWLRSDDISFHVDERKKQLLIVVDTPSTADEFEEIRKNKVIAFLFVAFICHFRFNGRQTAYTVDAVRGKTKTSEVCGACLHSDPNAVCVNQEHETDLAVDLTTAKQILVNLQKFDEQFFVCTLDVLYDTVKKEKEKQRFLMTIV